MQSVIILQSVFYPVIRIMSSLTFRVRADWAETTRRMEREKRRLLGLILGVVFFSAVVVGVVDRLPLSTAWRSFLSELASICLWPAVAVGYAWRGQRSARRMAAGAYLTLAVIMAFTDYLTKAGLPGMLLESSRAGQSILYTGGVMLLVWPLAVGLARRAPEQARLIGLDFTRWLLWLAWGLGVGILLAGHLLLTMKFARVPLTLKPWPYMAWHLFYEGGIQSFSEELFFRGMVFNYFLTRRGQNFWLAAIVTSLLYICVFLVKIQWSASVLILAGTVFYGFMMNICCAALYRWAGSIVPAVACNAVLGLAPILR